MITSLSGGITMNDDFTASLEQVAKALQDIIFNYIVHNKI